MRSRSPPLEERLRIVLGGLRTSSNGLNSDYPRNRFNPLFFHLRLKKL